MEDKKIETPKRVLARLVADEMDNVEGGMPPNYTISGYTIDGGGAWDSTQSAEDLD
jgi:hypothetical protein